MCTASGYRSNFSRALRNSRMSLRKGATARHIRGLAEKIWKVFAPSSPALIAAFSRDFARDVWMPIRTLPCYGMGIHSH